MRIHVTFYDRVGITQEVLALLGARNLNLDAVEMIPPNVYIDAPDLSRHVLDELHYALVRIQGVKGVELVDMLPGQTRRLQLDALLAAMHDPVLAVDPCGYVLLANPTLIHLYGGDPTGEPLSKLFGSEGIAESLVVKGFRVPICEVSLNGKDLLLDSTPIDALANATRLLAGGLLTLYPPSRMGEKLASLHQDSTEGLEALLGNSPSLIQVKARIHKVAALDAPLLIQGETGTGKELVARACHALSRRKEAPFLALNCAALPESLAESELFGYAAGAFTGARRGGKPGLMELADHGTVFLDEVGEMSPYLQAKLLRFLSDGRFRRVGGDKEVQVNVRVLCATHRNLERMVSEGNFREDLYYRLNVLNILVPALRERGVDILVLADHFLRQACQQIQRPACKLAVNTHPILLANQWPGNVRQLQNVIFRAAATCDGDVIDCDDLELAGTELRAPRTAIHEMKSLDDAVSEFECALLTTLYTTYPSTRQLANRLKTSHTAIGARLRKYGIGTRHTTEISR